MKGTPLKLLALGVVLLSSDGAAYELKFPERGEGAASSCLFYPVNCRMYAADIAGVRVGLWSEDPSRQGVLVSNGGKEWGGSRTGDDSTLWLFASGRARARFHKGRLVSFVREPGGERDEEMDREMLTQDVPRKTRQKTMRQKANHKDDGWFYWAKSGRMRLWYDNPNATGALFAEIALLCLAGALFLRRCWVKVGMAALAVSALGALAFTHSRGGVVAVAVGTVCLLLPVVHGLPSKTFRRIIFAVGAAAVVALAVMTPRIAEQVARRDVGNALRLTIWKDAPRMMAVAPDGWKTSTGYAWCDWFQPLDSDFSTTWMVNTHLSWLTQYGTAFRMCYISAWLFLLMYLAISAKRGKAWAFGLAQWSAFFTAMWFSTVGFEVSLWIVPVAALVFCLVAERKDLRYARMASCAGVAVAAGYVMLRAMTAWGADRERDAELGGMVEVTGNGVKIGRGEARNYLVHDNAVLTGGHHGVLGKDLRAFYAAHPDAPATLVVKSAKSMPEEVHTLVLAGKAADAYLQKCRKEGVLSAPKPKRLVLLSPNMPWKMIPEFVLRNAEVAYVTGEFAASGPDAGSTSIPDWVGIVPGCAAYVRDWTERSLR